MIEPSLKETKAPVFGEYEQYIVYADDPRVLCWLWNHKDAKETCIDESSEYVLFFVDAFEKERAVIALQTLGKHLTQIGSTPFEQGILDRACPSAFLEIKNAFHG